LVSQRQNNFVGGQTAGPAEPPEPRAFSTTNIKKDKNVRTVVSVRSSPREVCSLGRQTNAGKQRVLCFSCHRVVSLPPSEKASRPDLIVESEKIQKNTLSVWPEKSNHHQFARKCVRCPSFRRRIRPGRKRMSILISDVNNKTRRERWGRLRCAAGPFHRPDGRNPSTFLRPIPKDNIVLRNIRNFSCGTIGPILAGKQHAMLTCNDSHCAGYKTRILFKRGPCGFSAPFIIYPAPGILRVL